MRRALQDELEARVEALGTDGSDTRLARELMVDRFGPECAAWLVREMRGPLHRAGIFAVDVAAGVEPKPWFEIALAFLGRRRDWGVEARPHRGGVRFVIRWFGWQRHVPAARAKEVVRG